MSRFDDRFEAHGIHIILENVLTFSNGILQGQESVDVIVEIERIKQVISSINELLANCDPNLVSIVHLDAINNSLNQVYSHLNSYMNGRNIGYLHNANNQLDGMLPNLSVLLRPILPHDIEGVRKAVVSFRGSITQHLRYTEEEFSKIEAVRLQLEQGLNQVASTVELQKSRLDTAIAEFQEQFSKAEEKRREQFNISENETKKRLELFETERDLTFEELEKVRTNKFEDLYGNFNKLFVKFIEDTAELKNNTVEKSAKYIKTLEEYKNEAAKRLNIITISGMGSGYKTVAIEERNSLTFWRRATMISMILLVTASVISFFYPFRSGLIWSEIARRVFVAGAFATLAGYSARQAKIHLDAKRRYQKMELELTALNPYLAELEDSKRKEILGDMTGIFFGRSEVETDQKVTNEPTKEVSSNLVELAKLLESAQALLPTKKL